MKTYWLNLSLNNLINYISMITVSVHFASYLNVQSVDISMILVFFVDLLCSLTLPFFYFYPHPYLCKVVSTFR